MGLMISGGLPPQEVHAIGSTRPFFLVKPFSFQVVLLSSAFCLTLVQAHFKLAAR
jgi:hypothetical protein